MFRFRYKEFPIGKLWIGIGMSKRLALSIYIDRYFMGIDFLCFWISIEY
jgi:hypothetical protein